MAIFDFIKPKWKHSDPRVRQQAVREMEPDATERLQKIAITDLDMRVRVEAVQKITDEHLLTDFAASTGDSPVIEAARNQLNALYQESLFRVTDSNTRKQILKKLEDEEILTLIAEEIDDPDIRMAAADKVRAPERLCRIAESHCGLKTGLSIVARLDDPEHLKRVARNATNKKVRKQAEEKLAETATEVHLPEVEARKEAELTGLCRTLEDLENTWNWAVAEDLLEQTAADWRSLNPEEDHPLSDRFLAARKRIQDRLERLEREKQTRETLQSLCEAAEGLTDSPSQEALSHMADLEARWNGADLTPLPDSAAKALENRFQEARKSLDKHLEIMEEQAAARRRAKTGLEALCREAEALAADSGGTDSNRRWSSLQDRWKTLYVEDPETAPLLARFETAREAFSAAREALQAADAAARTAQEDRLRELCCEVEAAVDAEDRAGLVKKVKSAQEEWRSLGDRAPESKAELRPRFEAACDRFFEKQRAHWEQREWERWANLNQKEDLCKVVELLVRDGVVEGAPDVVRDARNRWRNIGPVSKEASEDIWNRFNRACDEIYGRCLAEKQTLADRLRTLTDPLKGEPSEDFNWTDTAEAVKTLQARWNAVGLLPAGVEKDLRREFQETCNDFFDRLRSFYQERDQARQENLAQKTRLAEEAEALADSEDWAETAGALKTLQRRWKSVGPVPKPAGDALWNRFQTACNTFFDRMKAAEPDNLARKEALCRKAKELTAGAVDDSDIIRVSRELMDLQRQWKSIGPVPAELAEDLWTRFREPCDAFFTRRNAFFKRRKAEQADNQSRKEALVSQAEALADSTDWRETGETLKALQQTWKSIGPAPRKHEQVLWERFRGACDNFFTRRNDHFGRLDRSRAENLEKKEQLCISLEALARLLMPEAAISGRGAAPAEQLSMALDYKEEILVPGNRKETWERAIQKVRALQAEWKTIGPVPADKDRDLWARFRQAADLFFRSPSTSFGAKDAGSVNDDDRMKEEEQT
ncbi:MAG: DUF349 domain-containing protein [Desulfococcaceae bacterium]